MTFATEFVNWPNSGLSQQTYKRCSPNLTAILAGARRKWPGLSSLGCYGVRAMRTSTTASAHSWGAALDLSYLGVSRPAFLGEVLPWLIGWSDELQLQAVHDYVGCRIWRAGRTPDPADACDKWWRAQRPDSAGMGSNWATWVHLETTPAGWADGRPLLERGID